MTDLMLETQTETGVDNFLATFYQLAAQDRIHSYFGGQGEMFSQFAAQIPSIRNADDFNLFISGLPSAEQREVVAKKEIKSQYAGIDAAVQEIEVERVEALKDPEIPEGNYFTDVVTGVAERFDVGDVETIDDIESLRFRLGDTITQTVNQRLDHIVNGCRQGDIVEVTQASGFDLETMDDSYYHGGDLEDVSLGSVGEITDVVSDDRVTVRFDLDDHQLNWQLHPDEVSQTGKNVYQEMLDNSGGDSAKVAEQAIATLETEVKKGYVREARKNLNRLFDAKIEQAATSLQTMFKLNETQLKALVDGNDFDYKVADPKTVPLGDLFGKLGVFARFVFNYKFDDHVPEPEGVVDETTFRDYVLGTAGQFGNAASIANKVSGIGETLMRRQYFSTDRLRDVADSEKLGHTLKHLVNRNNRMGVRRRMMYNDPDLFIAEPFSPPSETHDHVIILQAEYGCTHKCTYCTGYDGKLTTRDADQFREHVAQVKAKLGGDAQYIKRAFLAGGNVFRHDTADLIKYLEVIWESFSPSRIAAFTRTEGLRDKSSRELNRLYNEGLKVVYWGVESGSDAVLKYVGKGSTFADMEKAGKHIRGSNMKSSVMIMPGLGGLRHYADHVEQTARIINVIKPDYLTFLTVLPAGHSRYAQKMAKEQVSGENMPLTDEMVVEQMFDMIRLMKTDYECLAAAYQAPQDKVGDNPVRFNGRWQNGAKEGILRMLQQYFGEDHMPSPLIPAADFNKKSPIRAMVK